MKWKLCERQEREGERRPRKWWLKLRNGCNSSPPLFMVSTEEEYLGNKEAVSVVIS